MGIPGIPRPPPPDCDDVEEDPELVGVETDIVVVWSGGGAVCPVPEFVGDAALGFELDPEGVEDPIGEFPPELDGGELDPLPVPAEGVFLLGAELVIGDEEPEGELEADPAGRTALAMPLTAEVAPPRILPTTPSCLPWIIRGATG